MKSLRNIAERQLDLGIRKLWRAGIDIELWNHMLSADDVAMERLRAAWPGFIPGIVYGAEAMSRILGIPIKANGPVPRARYRSIIVYYDGWTLKDLRCSKAGLEKMWQEHNHQGWYDTFAWKADPGYYEVLLPVPYSNNRPTGEEVEYLHHTYPGFEPAPAPVAGTALLAEYAETGKDPLSGNIIRCVEQLESGFRVELHVDKGSVRVGGYWDGGRYCNVFLAASRLILPALSLPSEVQG
ncbi:MAG: hypothetical protein WCV62_00505 [Candidatus Peribacteraceae bacterium]|jgi:hypothetical protein